MEVTIIIFDDTSSLKLIELMFSKKQPQELRNLNSCMTLLTVAQKDNYACIYAHTRTHTHPTPHLFSNVIYIYMHITVYISVVSSITCSWLCFPSWARIQFSAFLLNNVKFLNVFYNCFLSLHH